MTIRQLRNHIPISGPARREPADGTESAMRVSLGFEPAWFHRRCRVDFSERWHTDPVYRHDSLVLMKAELIRAFPAATCWSRNSQQDTWTISGVYGAYFIPAMFGCQLQYAPDRWPVIAARPARSLSDLANLPVEDVLAAPIVADLFRQMELIAERAGPIHGYLNWQGVLNNAFNVCGQDLFVAMIETPELARRFLARLAQVMMALARRVQERQRQSGFSINQLDVSNCVMNMISPRLYREFIFPYDRQIAECFDYFGVHTCNWNIDPYLETLAELPNMGYIDMGLSSTLDRARAAFPKARRAVMYPPVKLLDATTEEIAADLRRVHAELAPCDLVLADIACTTPDVRVNEFLEICRVLESSEEMTAQPA
jgi:hypothetical protein